MRTLGFGRDVGNLNSLSQEQHYVQLLKCLFKGKVLAAQLLQILKIHVKWLPKQTINPGKRLFTVENGEVSNGEKWIFLLEEGTRFSQGLQMKRTHKQKIKVRKKVLLGRNRGRRKALSD